ncbi:unnamed protein product [Ilex paraguariensis]|uniref:Uncharacterized protein n=1 Tax=Ilex paraguariensis TaxID=185542 RepID=A0ABC8S0J2_9AQUA
MSVGEWDLVDTHQVFGVGNQSLERVVIIHTVDERSKASMESVSIWSLTNPLQVDNSNPLQIAHNSAGRLFVAFSFPVKLSFQSP